jgi:Protein of unknown function (DUF3891)
MVVLQPDHGSQTGLFAQLWGNDEVPALTDHVQSTRMAATHHDDGWAVWERHPTLDGDTGQPIQFHAVAPSEHIAAYRAGIERAAQLDPWTGLLVSMHGAGLYNDRYGTYRLTELVSQDLSPTEQTVVAEFLTDMAELQQRLAGQSLGHHAHNPAHEDPLVRHHYLLLQVWDRLSLQFAFRHASNTDIHPLPVLGSPSGSLACRTHATMALTLDPYPFATDQAVFPVAARMLPDRTYDNPEDFMTALVTAEPFELECRTLRPR